MLLDEPFFFTSAGSPHSPPPLELLEPPLALPQPWEALGPSPHVWLWGFPGPSSQVGDLSSEEPQG